MKSTELQPLFGAQLPSSAPWKPLTNKERFTLFWKQDFASTSTFVRPLLPAISGTITRSPESWARTWRGAGQRYGTSWINTVAGDAVETLGAAALHQETRYINCRCTKFWPRMWNAVAQTVVTYNDEGHWTFAAPRVLSYYASTAVVVYGLYPERERTASQYWKTSSAQFYFGAAGNIVREFIPDLMRMVRRKRAQPNTITPPSPSH